METEEDVLPPELTKLEESAAGLIYVEDGEKGMYEIEAFLGDASPICQVFKARYFIGKKSTDDLSGEIHQVVTLKLARIDDSPEFMNLRREVDDSFRISPNADDQDQENNNNVVTDNHVIVGIYESFYYRRLFCISMPYIEGGSLRYNINKRVPNLKLPEDCIAVVLREILDGLRFLHGRDRVHQKLNIGNIFVGEINDPYSGPVTIKLGYQGSTYFHHPEADCKIRIWDDSWDPKLGASLLCVASNLEVNRFWTIGGIYEPSRRGLQNITSKSDIWYLGVMALELAFGPFRYKKGMLTYLRRPDEFHTFLTELCNDEEIKLPELFDLFISDSKSRNAKAVLVSEEKKEEKRSITRRGVIINAAARKMKKGLINAGKKVKILTKKVRVKMRRGKPKSDFSEESSGEIPKGEVQLSNSFKTMVKKCLAIDSDARPTAEELLADPFFAEHQNEDLQHLKYHILSHPLRIHPPQHIQRK